MTRSFVIGYSLFLLLASASFAQLEIDWYTIDGGGGMNSVGGNLELSGTIGQPDAGPNTPMTGGNLELVGGFWTVPIGCACPGDLDGDGGKNGRDIQQFVGCLIAGGSCSCADVDGIGGVDFGDVSVLVSDLLAGDTCP